MTEPPTAYGEFVVDTMTFDLAIRQHAPWWPCFAAAYTPGVVAVWPEESGTVHEYHVRQARVLCALLNALRLAVESGQATLPEMGGG